MSTTPHVWLAYAAYPITTAIYFERALRRFCRVTTIGPSLSDEVIEKYRLQKMKQPLKEQDIATEPAPDMAMILAATDPANQPDLYFWIESVKGCYPSNLNALRCPKVCYLVDSHLNLATHLEWAKQFDMVFIAQREYLDEFRKLGMKAYWLPLGCDPEVHRRVETTKIHQIGFVGGVPAGSRREALLKSLASQIPVYYERCFLEDMARVFSESRVVFNEAIRNDLNMRVFEAMSTGTLLLTDMARNSGQDELFHDGEDYAVYKDGNICDTACFYLDNEELREQIASRGQRLVHNAHTYAHRMEDLLAVALGGKPDTFSAAELRQRSLAGVPDIDAELPARVNISSARRSFIIPVLDMSPASEYNILTLLKDLEGVEGDVIVVFNGQEVGEQLKDHPRIDRYAIMKHNIGVARAWNLGLEIAATPVVFILNADLHVERMAIDTIEQALLSLPDAACVGPQGSFFDFALAKDYTYFDKGTFNQPLEVDAVSGFFFAIKLQHFNEKIIRFENAFTPCYLEEWDLGLQIKRAGLKNYIVPTSAYDHHWSGTIRALREINFYEKAETAGEILLRNRRLFLTKWRSITSRENSRHLLESGFLNYASRLAHNLMVQGRFDAARQLIESVDQRCPGAPEMAALGRLIGVMASKAGD
ncbi:glycosyltransferase family protein [Pelotalea chapellei]|uniref:Glycosyltransferase n=1 Tax=Pelotalea chapellei TaxID=44671 RepID=A0ABS5UAL7_9BACT|nr:glycosyltransferase [Pelotalea chapellei]MBT1072727.1 glycosyltransferase [Pelotalea chapellei]